MSKAAALTSLTIRKGDARPAADAVPRGEGSSLPPVKVQATQPVKVPTAELEALNFKVPKEFKRRFKVAAANADMKGVEFLRSLLEQYEARKQ